MFAKLPGALARALLVIMMIILPASVLPLTGDDSTLVVLVIALFAGVYMVAEYSTASPSLVEFRDAPPYNRIRFGAAFFTIFLLTTILKGQVTAHSTFSLAVQTLCDWIGQITDFPFSPVRLMLVALPEGVSQQAADNLRMAAGTAYLISLVSVTAFVMILRSGAWPRLTQSFNFWVNLPTFDPTAGGDVVERLNRDSTINLVLGFLLPFMIPAALMATARYVSPIGFDDPQTLIWTVVIWAFLPATLLMRGIALSRVGQLIHMQRKRAYAEAAAEGMLPA